MGGQVINTTVMPSARMRSTILASVALNSSRPTRAVSANPFVSGR